MNKVVRKITILIICGAMLLGLLTPMVAHASGNSKVKKIGYTADIEKIQKKSTKAKKGYNVFHVKNGWVKFKAPKKKNYTVSVQIESQVEPDYNWGYMSFVKVSGSRTNFTKLRKATTAYGKTPTLNLGTIDWCEREASEGNVNKNPLYRNMVSRKAKIKLKKGETLYLYFWFLKKADVSVNIK